MQSISYEELMQKRQQIYDHYVQAGHATPFLLWDLLPPIYLFLALYWSSRLSPIRARATNIFVFFLVVAHSLYIITHRRCLSLASGYVIGLTLMWGVISSGVLLVVHNPSTDFLRLEWRKVTHAAASNGSAERIYNHTSDTAGLQRRKMVNGSLGVVGSHGVNAETAYELVWQRMPETMGHRIDWIFDLATSFRGPNWSHRIPTLPKFKAPPQPSKAARFMTSLEVAENQVMESSYTSAASRTFARNAVIKTVVAYLIIDLVKVIMISDDYFLGLAPVDAACDWPLIQIMHTMTGLPQFFLIRFTRLLVSLWGILNALFLVFSYSPTFIFCILPHIVDLRRVSYAPLTDMRFYPGYLSSPFPIIPDKGLTGLWGKCWHQMFRFGFSESSKPLLWLFAVDPKSQVGRTIQLFVAFGLSGCLHMVASYTCFSLIESKPLLPMLFFLSQAVGIIIQTAFKALLKKYVGVRPPKLLQQLANSAFVVAWLYWTGPLLADDFARSGIWLFEPVPVSFIRGLRGEGWWQWGGRIAGIWNGIEGQPTAFWNRGIGIF